MVVCAAVTRCCGQSAPGASRQWETHASLGAAWREACCFSLSEIFFCRVCIVFFLCVAAFFLRNFCFLGPTHLREIGRFSGGLLICLLCAGAVFLFGGGGRSWSISGSAMGLLGVGLLLMFGAKPSKNGFLCICAVGLWSQLKCICRGPLHKGPSPRCMWCVFFAKLRCLEANPPPEGKGPGGESYSRQLVPSAMLFGRAGRWSPAKGPVHPPPCARSAVVHSCRFPRPLVCIVVLRSRQGLCIFAGHRSLTEPSNVLAERRVVEAPAHSRLPVPGR